MSHFAVLVIGDNIEEQLAPFQENNMGDCPSDYMEFTDHTDECKAEYNSDDVDKNEYPTLIKYAKDYHGYEEDGDGRFGYWENPNAKWDWWVIGGRYRDRLKMNAPELALKGESMEQYPSLYRESTEGFGDKGLKCNIDWESMHGNQEDYDKAIRFWEMKVEGAKPETEEEEEAIRFDWYREGYYEDRYKTKEIYAQCCANFTMWAVVKDGQWYEKGDMGWWGMSGESDDEAVDWELNFYDRFIRPLGDGVTVTVVDCHI